MGADLAPALVLVAHVVVTGVLGAGALVHFLWACGIWWPAHDEDHLVSAVVGVRTAQRMPGAIPTLVVVVGLIVAASLPWWPGGRLRDSGEVVLATIFAVRGLLPLLPIWRRATAHQPFASLDRRFYGPVSLLLALSFWVLSGG